MENLAKIIADYMFKKQMESIPDKISYRQANGLWGIITTKLCGYFDLKEALKIKMSYERNSKKFKDSVMKELKFLKENNYDDRNEFLFYDK